MVESGKYFKTLAKLKQINCRAQLESIYFLLFCIVWRDLEKKLLTGRLPVVAPAAVFAFCQPFVQPLWPLIAPIIKLYCP